MVEYEADDALASAAAKAAKDDRVGKVLVCTPDKDLSQCVVGKRVVQLDRRRHIVRDEAGVAEAPSDVSLFHASLFGSRNGKAKTFIHECQRDRRRS
jgi:hypothetical protein